MESWREDWREGLAPQLSRTGLEALRKALVSDDARLLQGATTNPPPLQCVQDWPVEAACALGFCGWKGDGLETVAQVEEFFIRVCFEADQRLGDQAACRYFLNWYDETPREEMRRQLLPEVNQSLKRREKTMSRESNPDPDPDVPNLEDCDWDEYRAWCAAYAARQLEPEAPARWGVWYWNEAGLCYRGPYPTRDEAVEQMRQLRSTPGVRAVELREVV